MRQGDPPRFDGHRTMVDTQLSHLAAALAEPARTRMALALMDGRALTATELAEVAGVSPSTASSHLSRLTRSGLLCLVRQGRHRYFRLRDGSVAALVEEMMAVSAMSMPSLPRTGPVDPALRQARRCYDHLAGHCGVRLLERMRQAGHLAGHDGDLWLTDGGERWCRQQAIDIEALRQSRRPLCRTCLDWSERRMHLGGALGAALLEHMLAARMLRLSSEGRVLLLSPSGERFIEHLSG